MIATLVRQHISYDAQHLPTRRHSRRANEPKPRPLDIFNWHIFLVGRSRATREFDFIRVRGRFGDRGGVGGIAVKAVIDFYAHGCWKAKSCFPCNEGTTNSVRLREEGTFWAGLLISASCLWGPSRENGLADAGPGNSCALDRASKASVLEPPPSPPPATVQEAAGVGTVCAMRPDMRR